MNAKAVADHSRHVVRRLQTSFIHTKTHYSTPAGSSRLYAAFWGGQNLIGRTNWRRGKGRELANASAPNDWTGVWSLTQAIGTMLYYILHLLSASTGKTVNSVDFGSFGTDGEWWLVNGDCNTMQCTECDMVHYWAVTPVSSWAEHWPVSTDLSANCKLWMWNLNRIITEVRPNVEAWPSRSLRPMFGVNQTLVHL